MTINIYITYSLTGRPSDFELTLSTAVEIAQVRRRNDAQSALTLIARWQREGHEIDGGEANERTWRELQEIAVCPK